MACVGIAGKMGWSTLATYVCQKASYAALASRKGASAEESILLTTPCHPIAALHRRYTWSNRAVAAVSVSMILSELLIIILPAIPFSTSVARTAFEVSTALAIAILVIMIILLITCVLPIIFKWSVLHARDIPEPPKCTAETLALLQNPDTIARFAEIDTLVGEERMNAIRDWNLRWRIIRAYGEKNGTSQGWQLVGEEASYEAKPMIVT